MIPTEIHLPKPLLRRLQAHLDDRPHENLDSLFTRALEAYLAYTTQTPNPTGF